MFQLPLFLLAKGGDWRYEKGVVFPESYHVRVSCVLGPVLGPTNVTFLKPHNTLYGGCSHDSHMRKETEGVDSFPVAAVTNYHKLNGLKQHERLVVQFCRAEVSLRGSRWAGIEVFSGLSSSWRL